VLVILVVVGTWRLLTWRRRRDSVQDIAIVLYDEHGDEIERLQAPSARAGRFRFTLRRDTEDTGWAAGGGRLSHDPAGVGWEVRRRRGGLVAVSPEGTELALLLGEPVALGDGLRLGYEDARPSRQRQDEARRARSGPEDVQPPEFGDSGLV
jgi:hypothetical protein